MKKTIYWFALASLMMVSLLNAQTNTSNKHSVNNKKMEKPMNPKQVVEGFFDAMNQGDFAKAKSFMADNHSYTGPMFSTENPEEYFNALAAFEMEFAIETQDMIASEDGLTHRSLLKILNPVQATIPCCEVFKVSKGKITHQYFYFDTALFPRK